MPQKEIEHILNQLASSEDAHHAWGEFLEHYSVLIYQVISHFEPDSDKASDCFQFVCEQLIKDRFRRLSRFNVQGAAKFSTWLRAVIRNLCIDWHRRENGRLRPFKSILKLSSFDQQVFQLLYERGLPLQEGLQLLIADFPNVTEVSVNESRQRIESGLTQQQRWLLNTRMSRSHEATMTRDLDEVRENVADPRANPEAQAIIKERYDSLMRKLNGLPDQDRLLIRLRFEQELTLDQIAKLVNLGNAQRVDRQLKQILSQLRQDL